MRTYWTLVKRELETFYYSWTGYVVMAAVLLLLGLSFVNLITVLNSQATDQPVTEVFYSTMYFWAILILTTPLITMRSFAQEKASGTFETLMSTPVSDLQVTLAKFSGALAFYLITWLPLVGCLLIVRHYSNDPSTLDAGTLAATYLGIFLFGAVYVSIGCFASALTRSQMIAAIMSLALGLFFFFLSFLSLYFSSEGGGWRAQVLVHLGLIDHMEDFASGIVDSRPIVLYTSLTLFFMFLTLKVIESRRWK